MKFQVTNATLQLAEAYTCDKGSCCGNRDFEEYLDYIMQRSVLQKVSDWKEALELYFRLTLLAEM